MQPSPFLASLRWKHLSAEKISCMFRLLGSVVVQADSHFPIGRILGRHLTSPLLCECPLSFRSSTITIAYCDVSNSYKIRHFSPMKPLLYHNNSTKDIYSLFEQFSTVRSLMAIVSPDVHHGSLQSYRSREQSRELEANESSCLRYGARLLQSTEQIEQQRFPKEYLAWLLA